MMDRLPAPRYGLFAEGSDEANQCVSVSRLSEWAPEALVHTIWIQLIELQSATDNDEDQSC
jgi:hypothetical protein